MLAATTPDALSVVDPSLLKKAPSSIPSCLCLLHIPTASFWSPDNSFLYISSAHTIHKYDPLSNSLKDIYTSDGSEAIRHLVSKDKSTVIFDTGDKIHALECGSNPKVSQIFEAQKTPITSLSLSNDNTLLASTSATTVHVHNLTLGSHTTLRGLTLGGQDINTSAFHPHCRTRLLVAAGKHIMVYDTTRPSVPMKTIALAEAASGTITAIACSPFSKTLVAAATSGGFVGLIDLEKEKALFRTLNLKVPLTTIDFSPEGASIYVGTENGKILVIDLRALDKPPKAVVVSETGSRIETISMQKKVKSGTDGSTKTAAGSSTTKSPTEPLPTVRRAASTTVTQATRPVSKVAPSPARTRVAKVDIAASPAGRKVSSSKVAGTPSSTLKRAATTSNLETKKVFSPVRDPHGNSGSIGDISVQLDDLANFRGKADITPVKKTPTDNRRTRPSPSPRNKAPTISTGRVRSAKNLEAENPRRARTLPTTTVTTATTRTRKTSTTNTESASARENLAATQTHLYPPRRSRLSSPASNTDSDVISVPSSATTKLMRAAPAPATSTSRPPSSASRPGSSVSRTSGSKRAPIPISTARIIASRTPSPHLPDLHVEPTTPVLQKQKNTMQVLGLGTPEVESWIRAGQEDQRKKRPKLGDRDTKGKAKTVGFQEDEEEESDEEDFDHNERRREGECNLTMQISPCRPSVSASGSAQSWAASPALNPSHTGGVPGSSAHELLKTIVQDVMYDFQRDTKAEMMGLHLDLVRMGRGWKTELRSLMDEYVGDLKDLRDENQKLRLENERLRRGIC